MFKLRSVPRVPIVPVEGVHERLQGSTALRKTGAKGGARDGDGSSLAPGIAARGWQVQAEEYLKDAAGGRYRSTAVRAEVRLMEALQRQPPNTAEGSGGDEGGERPDAYRTAVCAQMLTELCSIAGPFTGVLGTIRDELVKAIYSEYYLSTSGALHFDQVPHFVVVGKLENDLAEMEATRDAWRRELLEHQNGVAAIEGRLRALDARAAEQDSTIAELRTALAEATERYAASKAEAKTSRDEAKRARRELLSAKEAIARESRGTNRDGFVDVAEHEAMREALHEAQRELAKALAMASSRRAFDENALQSTEAAQELESLREERDSLREVVERMAASGRDSMDVPTREELKHQTAALEATKAELETVRAEIEALRSGRTTAEGALDEAKELLAPEPDCVARASAAAAASGDAGNDGGGSGARNPGLELTGKVGASEASGTALGTPGDAAGALAPGNLPAVA